jgi:rhodanese-related sulfurtransferase
MMRRYHTIALAFALFSALALAGCGGSSGPEQATLTDVSAAQLEVMLASPQPPLVLDVRTTGEFATGHIPGSLNIPVSELPSRLGELQPSRPTVCVCGSGIRSIQAGETLLDAGFRSVYNLQGGLATWADPLET